MEGGNFTKIKFLAALASIRQKTFKKRMITGGFKYTRIILFNPEIVLEQLPEAPTRQETPSDIKLFSSFGSTPKTAEYFEYWARNLPRAEELSYSLGEKLNIFIKASIAQAHLAENLHQDLIAFTAAERERRERVRGSQSRIQKDGVVSSTWLKRINRAEVKYNINKELDQLRPK
ncbi:hypothetical protein BDV12DRAFT_205289 [Aspergillus spectabilis]